MVKRSSIIKKLLVSSVILLLVGCSTTKSGFSHDEAKVVEVKVPVSTKVVYPSRDLPKLPIDELVKSSTTDEVVKAYDRSIQMLITELYWYRDLLYRDSNSE